MLTKRRALLGRHLSKQMLHTSAVYSRCCEAKWNGDGAMGNNGSRVVLPVRHRRCAPGPLKGET